MGRKLNGLNCRPPKPNFSVRIRSALHICTMYDECMSAAA